MSPFLDRAGSNRSSARFARQAEDDSSAALVAQLPRLRRYAIALVGDVALAEDLLQDCVERALKNRPVLKEEQRMYGWLRSILYNLYMDELRRRRRSGVVANEDDVVNSLMHSTPSADRSSTLDFVRALGRLSAEHRQLLLLVGLEGLSYRDAATELNVPIGTVMSRLARARDHLRQLLDPPDPGPSPAKGRY